MQQQLDDLDLDEDELARVAMFPLPNVVLLPGSLLPLHIFEPRYRDMTRDVLEGSGVLALARLRPGHQTEYQGRPPVYETIGVGRVIDSYELPDGRYNILVRGLIRASLVEELPPVQSYREVRTEWLEDRFAEPAVLGATQQKLISLCDQLSVAIEEGGAELRELARSVSSPGGCADVVSAVLVTDPDERQHLLDSLDPLHRLERVIQHVSRILLEFDHEPRLLN